MRTPDGRMLGLGIVALVAVGAAFVFVGARPTPADHARYGAASAPSGVAYPIVSAPSYGSMRDVRRGPNASRYDATVEGLQSRGGPVFSRVPSLDNRAYEGAPPTVPHTVTQRTLDCAACHTTGLVVAGRVAPPMPHDPYPSCTQCHVPQKDPRPLPSDDSPPGSSFVGLGKPSP